MLIKSPCDDEGRGSDSLAIKVSSWLVKRACELSSKSAGGRDKPCGFRSAPVGVSSISTSNSRTLVKWSCPRSIVDVRRACDLEDLLWEYEVELRNDDRGIGVVAEKVVDGIAGDRRVMSSCDDLSGISIRAHPSAWT
jgi:hypothetical protein